MKLFSQYLFSFILYPIITSNPYQINEPTTELLKILSFLYITHFLSSFLGPLSLIYCVLLLLDNYRILTTPSSTLGSMFTFLSRNLYSPGRGYDSTILSYPRSSPFNHPLTPVRLSNPSSSNIVVNSYSPLLLLRTLLPNFIWSTFPLEWSFCILTIRYDSLDITST